MKRKIYKRKMEKCKDSVPAITPILETLMGQQITGLPLTALCPTCVLAPRSGSCLPAGFWSASSVVHTEGLMNQKVRYRCEVFVVVLFQRYQGESSSQVWKAPGLPETQGHLPELEFTIREGFIKLSRDTL